MLLNVYIASEKNKTSTFYKIKHENIIDTSGAAHNS